jgi:hypothetical protein
MGYTQNFSNTMFFRPNFCANCGEKIERADWGLLTSRRFCQVCESEFKGQDLIPRVIVSLGVVAGVFGFGSYLKSGIATETRAVKLQQPVVAATAQQLTNVAENKPQTSQSPLTVAALPSVEQPPKAKVETRDSQYFCGAETKKGTPCSRRVKGNVRCFQHVGMPAMLPVEKLKLN